MTDEQIAGAVNGWQKRYPAVEGVTPPRPASTCLEADLIALELADRHIRALTGKGIENLSECREKVRQKWQQRQTA